jgi:hypothetical protein
VCCSADNAAVPIKASAAAALQRAEAAKAMVMDVQPQPVLISERKPQAPKPRSTPVTAPFAFTGSSQQLGGNLHLQFGGHVVANNTSKDTISQSVHEAIHISL